MNPAQPPFIIRPVRRGQPISGAHLSKLSEGINRMNAGCAPPRQIFPQASPSQVGGNQKLYVISVQANYLTCNTKSDGSGDTYYVAKPTRLRSTDTAARAVAGNTYTVTKSAFTTGVTSGDAQTCTATRSSDSGTYTLEVVEPYLAGDEICALPFTTGIVDDSSNPINFLDANVDARHWAVKASS